MISQIVSDSDIYIFIAELTRLAQVVICYHDLRKFRHLISYLLVIAEITGLDNKKRQGYSSPVFYIEIIYSKYNIMNLYLYQYG